MLTKEAISALSTGDLIKHYNSLTGKSIKGFHTRKKGEGQVLAAQSKANGGAPAPKPKTVRGTASGKTGRPKVSFTVKLTEGSAESKPHAKSDRMAAIEWLRARESKSATIEELDAHFKKNMRGVVQKLVEKHWLKRS